MYTASFFLMILIICQEMGLIELFKRSFSRSERFDPFSHIYIIQYERSEVTQKVIFNVNNFQFGPLWYIWANISETVHAMTNVSIKHL